jgi:hypothetical protein
MMTSELSSQACSSGPYTAAGGPATCRPLLAWLCSRLAWFRTLSLHTPQLCNGHPSIWNHDLVGPGIRLGFPV